MLQSNANGKANGSASSRRAALLSLATASLQKKPAWHCGSVLGHKMLTFNVLVAVAMTGITQRLFINTVLL